MQSLSATPTTTPFPFMCPECASAPVPGTDRCQRCGYAYPTTYVVPYDHKWSFASPYETELRRHRGLRLMGKFVGSDPQRLQELAQVEYLYLSRYPSFTFEWLTGFRRLRVLELDFLQVSDLAGIDAISSLSILGLTELRKLESIETLARMPLLGLRVALCSNVNDWGPVASMPRLRRLQIEAKSLPSLEFVSPLSTLRDLGLAVDRIGGEWLGVVSQLRSLEWLGIRKKALAKGALDRLQSALPGCQIQVWP